MTSNKRARPALRAYQRQLPHLQSPDATIFATFNTWRRWALPPETRGIALDCCVREHRRRMHLHAAVVMPDHVHLLFTPLRDDDGDTYGLAEILGAIKGASAHRINSMLHRRGRVWQDESFDHMLRSGERVRATAEYIVANPVRAGLAATEDDWPWLWREWEEGLGFDE